MIVYMLVNVITEMVYIGKTTMSLEERWMGHVSSAFSGAGQSNCALHIAIRRWGPDVWDRVVLQSCMTEDELSVAEGNWIERCDSRDPAVGYNTAYVESGPAKTIEWYLRAMARRCNVVETKGGKIYTPEQMEKFREWGKKGAASGMKNGCRRKEDMTEEELQKFREWGKKGAKYGFLGARKKEE